MEERELQFTVVSAKQFNEIIKEINVIKEMISNMQKKDFKGILTDIEARKYLNVSSRTLYNYRVSGKISFSQVGKKVYYKMVDIEEFINSQSYKRFSN